MNKTVRWAVCAGRRTSFAVSVAHNLQRHEGLTHWLPHKGSVWLTVFLFGVVGLAGCQSSPLVPEGDFQTQGKLALRGPSESLTVRFRWVQVGTSYDLELWGPFGQGRTRLQGSPSRLAVLDGRGQVVSQGQPEQVIRDQIGWDLPLGAMVSWAQGVPQPRLPVADERRDASGQYQGFRQAGWQIQYLAYHSNTGSQSRPKTLVLTQDEYRIKVAFSRWR